MVVNTSHLPTKSSLVAVLAGLCFLTGHPAPAQIKAGVAVSQHLDAGNAYMRQGKLDAAKSEYQAAVDADPRCTAAHNNVGLVYMHKGDLDKAAEEFKTALSIDSLFLPSLSNLGQIHYAKGQYDEAILCYRQTLQLAGGNDADVHVNLANALRDKNPHDFKEAMEHYREALKMNPSEAIAYNGLAKMYYIMGRFDLSAEEAHKAIKLKPDYAMAYYHLGLAEAAQQHISKAVDALENSLKYETNRSYEQETRRLIKEVKQAGNTAVTPPQAPTAKVDLGEAEFTKVTDFIKTGQYLRAQKDLDELTKDKGADDPVLWNNLGFVRMSLGHWPEAIEAYKKASELREGKYPTAEYNMAQTYRLMGDNKEAENACRRALDAAKATGTPFPPAQNLMGMLLKSRGDLKGAEAAYKLALTQAGNDLPVVHYNLALLLEKEDQARDAVRHYKAYLSLAPNGKNAKEARKHLKLLGYQ